jgi:hypothetical protein
LKWDTRKGSDFAGVEAPQKERHFTRQIFAHPKTTMGCTFPGPYTLWLPSRSQPCHAHSVKNILIGFAQAPNVTALSSAADDLGQIGMPSLSLRVDATATAANQPPYIVTVPTRHAIDQVLLDAVTGTLEAVFGCPPAWVRVI